jgi:hypothetical protein
MPALSFSRAAQSVLSLPASAERNPRAFTVEAWVYVRQVHTPTAS